MMHRKPYLMIWRKSQESKNVGYSRFNLILLPCLDHLKEYLLFGSWIVKIVIQPRYRIFVSNDAALSVDKSVKGSFFRT
ncbi:hypothetical protein D3C73_1275810 [compost metagenome]